MCNFIPVQRIHSLCAHGNLDTNIHGHEEIAYPSAFKVHHVRFAHIISVYNNYNNTLITVLYYYNFRVIIML